MSEPSPFWKQKVIQLSYGLLPMLPYEIHDCFPSIRPRSLVSAQSPLWVSSTSLLSFESAWSLPQVHFQSKLVWVKKKIVSISSHTQSMSAYFFLLHLVVAARLQTPWQRVCAYKHHDNECARAYRTSAPRLVRFRVATYMESGVIDLSFHRDTSSRGNTKCLSCIPSLVHICRFCKVL